MPEHDPPIPRDTAPGADPLRRPSTDAPDGSALDAHLLELRARLKQAREERGGCPPWSEVRADLVPGGSQREGRAQRQAHVAVCPYCSTHVTEWRKSDEFAADRLEALERGVARGIAGGAMGLIRTLGRALPSRSAEPGTEPKPRRERKARVEKRALSAGEERALAEAAAAAEAAPAPAPAVPEAPAPARYVPPAPRPAVQSEPTTSGRMVVVEMADGRTPPEMVFLCARVLDAEVAQVDSIDELVGDPDLPLVIGVVLGGSRSPASWPDVVRHARSIVKGRPVLLLASFGAETTPGARRALGDSLLNEADPPERLLLALDPGL